MLDISKIKDLFEEVIEKHKIDKSHLWEGGKIYYCNGNDGTDFDYNCNNMTCEFYVYWKNGDGAIKCNQRGDELQFYIYPEDNPFGGEYKFEKFHSPFNLYYLCCCLKGTFDDNEKWDEEITNWVLDGFDYFIDETEDEDDYYDDYDEEEEDDYEY